MSEQDNRNHQSFLHARATRRAVVSGLGAGVAGMAFAGAGRSVTGQSSTPVIEPAGSPVASPASSPMASPMTSPEATPPPDPVPATSLTIIRDQRPAAAGTPVQGGDLRLFVRGEDLSNFSPVAQRQDFQIPISYLDPLVWIDEVTMEPEPWLATSWIWSTDGLTLTFNLRDDVTFHDGSPLTSADVIFSLLVYRDDHESANATFLGLVNRVESSGEFAVSIGFDEPDGAFLFNVASLPIFQRAQYIAHWEKDFTGERSLSGFDWNASLPQGTGPWKIEEVRSDVVTLVRNDAYWAEAPHFDRLILIAQDDQQARIDAWRKGDVDIVWPLRSTEMGDLWDENGQLYIAEAPVAFFAAFNFANPANATPDMMRDPALRQALSLAVDRQSYARDVFFDFIDEKKSGTITQPWAHDDSITNPEVDIERAIQLLDDAGWQDVDGDGMREDAVGNKLDLYCIVAETQRPELLAILDRLGENFSRLGARLTVQRLEPAAFDARWTENRQYDMIALSVMQYPAFAEFDLYGSAWDIRSNRTGWNPGGYSNETVDAAINEYFAAWKIDAMKAALSKLQQAANDDLFGLWFGFPHDLVLVRSDIQGFAPNKMYQTWGTRQLWRGEAEKPVSTPDASPAATPDASPAESPEASPIASPDASPVS